MEVDFAFLAHTAEVVDGKIYVMGGGIDTVWADNTPATHPFVSFVVRMLFSPSEFGIKHKIEISIINEDGQKIAPPIGGEMLIHKNPNLPQGWKQPHITVMNFGNLKFDRFGDYSFNVLINNDCKKSIPFRVAKNPK